MPETCHHMLQDLGPEEVWVQQHDRMGRGKV